MQDYNLLLYLKMEFLLLPCNLGIKYFSFNFFVRFPSIFCTLLYKLYM